VVSTVQNASDFLTRLDRTLTHQVDRQGRNICFVGDGNGTASFARALEAAVGIAADASYKIIADRRALSSIESGQAKNEAGEPLR
jgi:hypothetical protein